jgi:hypothetical protein
VEKRIEVGEREVTIERRQQVEPLTQRDGDALGTQRFEQADQHAGARTATGTKNSAPSACRMFS